MKEEDFVASLEDLTGKVAIVTGGARGIGFETTVYLAKQGATVYVAARDSEVTSNGIAEARKQVGEALNMNGAEVESRIKFHLLDQVSVATAWQSAEAFKRIESRLDILICNAGVSMTNMSQLSPDGYDLTFATNHLGVFAFTTALLDLIKKTADENQQDGRIVMTCSTAYKLASKLDYEMLSTRIPDDGKKLKDIIDAYKRYSDSKLAMAHATIELSRRIREIGISNVYVNACQPGNAVRTTLGKGHQSGVGPWFEEILRSVLDFFMGTTTKDTAKTQVYLASNQTIKDKDIHGKYWEPSWSFFKHAYQGCASEEWNQLSRDPQEIRKLWDLTVEILKKNVGEEQLQSSQSLQQMLGVPWQS